MAKSKHKFWQFRAAAEDKPAELLLYGDISSYSWWGDEITPKQFKQDLDALGDVDEINVFINSPGGDVFAGQAIHSMLKRNKAKITVYVDGLAASIASVVAMAGDTVKMPRNAMMMIHNPYTFAFGGAEEFRKVAETLDQVREAIIATYEAKTGLEKDKIIELMDAESWMTAEEALEYGFADEIEEEKEIAASLLSGVLVLNGQEMDLSRFKNPPKLAFLPPKKQDEPPKNKPDPPPDPPPEPAKGPDNTSPQDKQTDNGLLSLCRRRVQVNKNKTKTRLGGKKEDDFART